jgi:glucokinase
VSDRIIIGMDIGGTKTAVVSGDTRGNIRHRIQFPTEAGRGFDPVFRELCGAVRELRGREKDQAAALSVSIGGPLEVLKGIIHSPPHLPGWTDIPLKEMLAGEFHLPVYVEHDGNAGALAEWFFGAGRGFRNIIFITMGTGTGAGLILDGRLYRGTTDVAGEIGHTRIAEHGPPNYGKSGSLEGFASGSGISRLATMMYPAVFAPGTGVMQLHQAYLGGSPEAMAVFDRAALSLGRGLANLADTLNPERIILGGLGMRLTEALVDPARRIFLEEALPEAQRVCEIVPAMLGEAIGDLAALCAAYDQGAMREPPVSLPRR